jgi:hypothetical protein
MFLKKLLTWKDLAENPIKKIIFVVLGILIFFIGLILGIKINFSNDILRLIYSLIFGVIGFGYFIYPVVWISFNKPIYLFKNKILGIMFPLLLNWSSFVVYIIFDRTEKIAIISLILAFIGYIFSGTRSDIILNKVPNYTNYIDNWLFSRFFILTFLSINFFNLFNILQKYIFNI